MLTVYIHIVVPSCIVTQEALVSQESITCTASTFLISMAPSPSWKFPAVGKVAKSLHIFFPLLLSVFFQTSPLSTSPYVLLYSVVTWHGQSPSPCHATAITFMYFLGHSVFCQSCYTSRRPPQHISLHPPYHTIVHFCFFSHSKPLIHRLIHCSIYSYHTARCCQVATVLLLLCLVPLPHFTAVCQGRRSMLFLKSLYLHTHISTTCYTFQFSNVLSVNLLCMVPFLHSILFRYFLNCWSPTMKLHGLEKNAWGEAGKECIKEMLQECQV